MTRETKVWWVNQGRTHLKEIKEHGTVAAVTRSRNGKKLEHHENVMLIHSEDIVISNASGKIIAIGHVTSEPKEDPKHLWDGENPILKRPAYVANVDYYRLKSPIATKQFRGQLQALNIPDGPINSSCNVRQGYAFPFDWKGLDIIKNYQAEKQWPDWA
jgi:hypothetical protein